jgi:hypothetical protein
VMPDHIRALAKIDDGLFFNGAGRTFLHCLEPRWCEMDDEWIGREEPLARVWSQKSRQGARQMTNTAPTYCSDMAAPAYPPMLMHECVAATLRRTM